MAHRKGGQRFSSSPQTFSSNFSGPCETSLDLTWPPLHYEGAVVHTRGQPRCPGGVGTPQDTFSPDEQGLVHGRVHLLDPDVRLRPSSPLREASEEGFNGGICDLPNVQAATVHHKTDGLIHFHPPVQINPSALKDSAVSFSWML